MRKNNVSDLLIKLRKEYGYTQSDLADRLDVSFQAVSKWERGENLPDAYTLLELAKIYDVTVDEILKGEVQPKQLVEKRNMSEGVFATFIIVGVALCILSPVTYFMLEEHVSELAGIIGILSQIAIAVAIFIYAGIAYSKTVAAQPKREMSRRENIVYGLCVVIFLISGFVFDLFHIAWIVFILGWVVIQYLDKDQE